MQLASQGMRFATNLTRKAPNVANRHGVIQPSRGVHIPSSGRFYHIRLPNPGTAQKLFSYSRNVVSRFVTHLTAPGLATPLPSTVSGYPRVRGVDAFRQGLSFPVRTALSRPVQHQFLPRAPTIPRHIAEVGLGTARKFSTGRPIFQHLVDNVPVAARAFYELDWETKMQKEREMMRLQRQAKKVKKTKKGKEMAKPKQQVILEEKTNDAHVEEGMDQYFSKEVIPEVTTYLLVPLAPTPTGRTPLPSNTVEHGSLLPLPTVARIHNDHQLHSCRVAALFSRLDAANVWEDGVQCQAYSHLAPDTDDNRVCSVMKVIFVGWTKAQVRGVIGESGTGWCALEEVRASRIGNQQAEEEEFDNDDALSDVSSPSSFASGEWASGYSSPVPGHPAPSFSSKMETDQTRTGIQIDPAQSFILPTLDFSSSFSGDASASGTSGAAHEEEDETTSIEVAPQPFAPRSESDFDPWSEVEEEAAGEGDDDVMSVFSDSSSSSAGFSNVSSLSSPTLPSSDGAVFVDPPTLNGWFGFSSRYERVGSEPGEELFS